MKITKENIQFIDNYLTKSEVVYDDLKLELIDHISSAVQDKMNEEQIDFYNAFKNYMVMHKKDILKAGKVNQPIEIISTFKIFIKFCLKKEMLALSLISFGFLYYNYDNLFLNNELQSHFFSMIIVVSFSLIWMLVFYFVFKKRFYVLEKNFVIINVIIQMFNIINLFTDSKILFTVFITILFPIISLLFICFMVYNTFIFYSKTQKLYATN